MTTRTVAGGVGQAELDAARLLLDRMGLSASDLLAGTSVRPLAPTFAEYVAATVSGASRRAYKSYWRKIVDRWGGRRLDEPTPSEIKQFGEHIRAGVVVRRNARGENSAVEHFLTACDGWPYGRGPCIARRGDGGRCRW